MDEYMRNALENDRQNYLISDVLAISDKMSMLNSVEMRLPYLDISLSSYVRKVPPAILLSHGGKGIPKKILKKYGGKKFSDRKKEGFGLPLGNWLRNEKHDYLWELFSEDDHLIFDFVRREKITRLIENHRQGSADLSQALWTVLILGYWLAKEFE
jgi:asparagine synthase (glutamine-hydrolysing)